MIKKSYQKKGSNGEVSTQSPMKFSNYKATTSKDFDEDQIKPNRGQTLSNPFMVHNTMQRQQNSIGFPTSVGPIPQYRQVNMMQNQPQHYPNGNGPYNQQAFPGFPFPFPQNPRYPPMRRPQYGIQRNSHNLMPYGNNLQGNQLNGLSQNSQQQQQSTFVPAEKDLQDFPLDKDPEFRGKLDRFANENLDLLIELVHEKMVQQKHNSPSVFAALQKLSPFFVLLQNSHQSQTEKLEKSLAAHPNEENKEHSSRVSQENHHIEPEKQELEDSDNISDEIDSSRDSSSDEDPAEEMIPEWLLSQLSQSRVLCPEGKQCSMMEIGCNFLHTNSVCGQWQNCMYGNRCSKAHYIDLIRTVIERKSSNFRNLFNL